MQIVFAQVNFARAVIDVKRRVIIARSHVCAAVHLWHTGTVVCIGAWFEIECVTISATRHHINAAAVSNVRCRVVIERFRLHAARYGYITMGSIANCSRVTCTLEAGWPEVDTRGVLVAVVISLVTRNANASVVVNIGQMIVVLGISMRAPIANTVTAAIIFIGFWVVVQAVNVRAPRDCVSTLIVCRAIRSSVVIVGCEVHAAIHQTAAIIDRCTRNKVSRFRSRAAKPHAGSIVNVCIHVPVVSCRIHAAIDGKVAAAIFDARAHSLRACWIVIDSYRVCARVDRYDTEGPVSHIALRARAHM
jgi:hypothetical protein